MTQKNISLEFIYSQKFWLLLFTALAIAVRFLKLGSAPFVADEPTFQLMLDEHFSLGTIPRHALVGSKGVPYGPTALWLYGAIRFFSDNIRVALFANVLLFALSLFVFYKAVKNSWNDNVASWCVALLASSPYLFFYSRVAWDVPLLVSLTSFTIYLLVSIAKKPSSIQNWGILGVVCGLIFNTHLMGLPVLFSLFLCLVFLAKKYGFSKAFRTGFVYCGLGFALTTALYFSVLLKAHFLASPPMTDHSFLEEFWGTLQGMFRFLSAGGMEYFITNPLSTYTSTFTLFLGRLPTDVLLKIISFGAIIWFGFSALKNPTENILKTFSVLCFFTMLFYLKALHIAFIHPHYFLPIWWIAALFATVLIAKLPRYPSWMLSFLVLVLILTNTLFGVETFSSIFKNHGTQGIYYGASLSENESALRHVCELMEKNGLEKAQIDFKAVTGILEPSVVFLSKHIKECKAKTLFTNPTVSTETGMPRIILRYQQPQSLNATIIVEK